MGHSRNLEAEASEDAVAGWLEFAGESRRKYFVRGVLAAGGLSLAAVGLGELISIGGDGGVIELVVGAGIAVVSTNEAR